MAEMKTTRFMRYLSYLRKIAIWLILIGLIYIITDCGEPSAVIEVPTSNTAIDKPPPTPKPTIMSVNALLYDSGHTAYYDHYSTIGVATVSMGGAVYEDAVSYGFDRGRGSTGGYVNGERGLHSTSFSLHNLDSKYKIVGGYIGRVDDSLMNDGTFNFYSDGILLSSYRVNAQDLPLHNCI